MSLSQKQIEAVSSLPAPKRYDHFIKKVVGWKRMWGLYSDGWAMSESQQGERVLPLWPEKEYAELCATGVWSSYEARPIELDEAIDEMIPLLKDQGIQPGVFFIPIEGSIDIDIDTFDKDLRGELSKYE